MGGIKKKATTLLVVLFWLALWQAVSMFLRALYPHGALLLPSPIAVVIQFGKLALTAGFWKAVGFSSARIIGGFAAGTCCGIFLAMLSAKWRAVKVLFSPLMSFIKAVPVVSFIILALVWLNSRSLPFFITFLMVLPPIYLNVLTGISQTDAQLLEMAEVFQIPFFRRVQGIYIPHVLPYFRSAASLALGLCWKAGVAAEVIALPNGSLGEKLYQAKVYFQTPDLFAWTAAVLLVSFLFEKLFLALIDAWQKKGAAHV